jgi:iron(III) transport system permease protein
VRLAAKSQLRSSLTPALAHRRFTPSRVQPSEYAQPSLQSKTMSDRWNAKVQARRSRSPRPALAGILGLATASLLGLIAWWISGLDLESAPAVVSSLGTAAAPLLSLVAVVAGIIVAWPLAGRDGRHYIILGVLLAALAICLLYPIYLTVRGGFYEDPATRTGFSIRHLQSALTDPRVQDALFNSFKIAVATTILATLIALPLAVLAANFNFPGKKFFSAAVLVPMILPPFVGAIGMRALLGRDGSVNALLGTEFDVLGQAKFWGVVFVQSFSLYPIIFLNTTAALANLDPALQEAAENLGARPWRRFFKITLPLIRPGIFAGATIVFIWAFTELGTPLMFGLNEVTSVQIFNGLKEVENSSRPYVLTAIMLVAAVSLYLIGKKVFGGQGYAMYSKASRAASEKTLTGLPAILATSAFAIVCFSAVLPHLGVVLTSLTVPGQWYQTVMPTMYTGAHYQEALGAADAFQSIKNSLSLAAFAMVLDCFIGVLVAYIIVRTRIRGRGLLDALCMLPLAVPGLVMAFGYVAMSLKWPFGAEGPLTPFASIFAADPSPVPFLIVAYATRRLPYIVRSTIAGLEQTSGELEEAAVNLGASRLTAARKVIIPLILANIIAGGLLVFSFSMLEVSDSLLLAQQNSDFPITKQIWAFMDRLGDGPYIASAMGVWGMALLTVTIFAASVLLGKKLGSIFRV